MELQSSHLVPLCLLLQEFHVVAVHADGNLRDASIRNTGAGGTADSSACRLGSWGFAGQTDRRLSTFEAGWHPSAKRPPLSSAMGGFVVLECVVPLASCCRASPTLSSARFLTLLSALSSGSPQAAGARGSCDVAGREYLRETGRPAGRGDGRSLGDRRTTAFSQVRTQGSANDFVVAVETV